MAGIRIYHPVLRSHILRVPHPGDERTGRRPKDYFIQLDAEGNCIVSETVWMRLEEARLSGFSQHGLAVLNVVERPPCLQVGNDHGSLPVSTVRLGQTIPSLERLPAR